ncbi:MAG TPA: putative porin [Steroidobacteraceae bacterium]
MSVVEKIGETPKSRTPGFLRAGIIAAIVAMTTPAAAQTADELRREIEALRAEQARINELARELDRKLQALEARAAASTETATSANAPAAARLASRQPQSSEPSRLEISGDLRLRTQGDYADDARDRESAQVRGRLGAKYRVNETIKIGARLVTGDPDDPNSTDVQLSNFDDDLQFTLDQAYVQFDFGNLSLYGGKIPQPFTRTDLVWDGDVNPQGVSAVYRRPLEGGSAFRVNGLFFLVDEDAVAADSTMTGMQLGYDFLAGDAFKFDLSFGYYDYRLGSVVGGDAGDFRSNLRNPDGSYQSDFDLGDAIVGATWTGLGERWPLRAVADYVHNFGAINDEDTGFGMDLSIGRASQAGDWRVTYGYSVAETEAVLAAFSHDNIALATNYRLHALTFDYVPMPKTLLSAIWYHYKPDERLGAVDPDWIERLRVAFAVSF